jgi:hypothetical protein
MAPEPEEADEVVVEETRLLFTEADEVERLIFSLGAAGAAGAAQVAEDVAKILDRYQEQPSVLDPKLEALVMPLLAVVRAIATGDGDAAVLRPACLVMYSVCKVRGYKTIVKFVPHEARDLEPLVALLASVPPDDHEAWQVAYSLMIWLSMVVMVPFDLSIIDSSTHSAAAGGDAERVPLVKRIEQLACAHLSSPGPARDAAAILLARLLTRPGLQPMLRGYITWGAHALDEARGMAGGASFGSVSFTMVGVYSSLAAIFKLGHREELMPQLAHLGARIALSCGAWSHRTFLWLMARIALSCGAWRASAPAPIDTFQHLLPPALFDCFHEKRLPISQHLLLPALFDCSHEATLPISNVRSPSAGATETFGRGV